MAVRNWAVFDLDGTICDVRHRLQYAKAKEWDEFHGRCIRDEPIWPVIHLARAWMNVQGNKIMFCTGRTDPYRHQTRLWLENYSVPGGMSGPLLMRKQGDHRKATDVKPELLQQYIENNRWTPKTDQIVFIVEDTLDLVEKWRELGYTCLHTVPVP